MKQLTSLMIFGWLLLVGASPGHTISYTFTATLNGASENPSNPSLGTGVATVSFDPATHLLNVAATFSGLTGTTSVAHIHCCIPAPGNIGVAVHSPSLAGFPIGVTSGTFSNTFDTTLASTFGSQFIANNGGTVSGAEAALFAGLQAGQAYFNIHTAIFPGGEIRGFLHAVPEPGALGLLLLGLGGLALSYTRRQV